MQGLGKFSNAIISQYTVAAVPVKQSILEAIEHLLARKRDILPLFLVPARPMKDEWNINPYLGVLLRVFNALNRK